MACWRVSAALPPATVRPHPVEIIKNVRHQYNVHNKGTSFLALLFYFGFDLFFCFCLFVSFYLFIYLFYKLRQEAWITNRASFTTSFRKKKKKKRKKDCDTTNKNDNTLERTKKEMEIQKQNWGGHR